MGFVLFNKHQIEVNLNTIEDTYMGNSSKNKQKHQWTKEDVVHTITGLHKYTPTLIHTHRHTYEDARPKTRPKTCRTHINTHTRTRNSVLQTNMHWHIQTRTFIHTHSQYASFCDCSLRSCLQILYPRYQTYFSPTLFACILCILLPSLPPSRIFSTLPLVVVSQIDSGNGCL